MNTDFPPTKRRRIDAFANTIITGAVTVALVGTAVGLTAYRYWRGSPNQPNQHEEDSPPPYDEGWAHVPTHNASTVEDLRSPPLLTLDSAKSSQSSPQTMLNRKRSRTTIPRLVGRRSQTQIARPMVVRPRGSSPIKKPSEINPQSEDTGDDDMTHGSEMDDQMDWMSARLRDLIEEGQKALGREIVFGVDAAEGEEESDAMVDDCTGEWEEEGPHYSRPTTASRLRAARSSNSLASPRRTPSPSKSAQRGRKATGSPVPHNEQIFPRSRREQVKPLDGLYRTPAMGSFDRSSADSDLQVAMDRVRRAYGVRS